MSAPNSTPNITRLSTEPRTISPRLQNSPFTKMKGFLLASTGQTGNKNSPRSGSPAPSTMNSCQPDSEEAANSLEAITEEDVMDMYHKTKGKPKLSIAGTGVAAESSNAGSGSGAGSGTGTGSGSSSASAGPQPASRDKIKFPTYETYRAGPRKAENFIELRKMIATSEEDELELIRVHVQDYLTVGSRASIPPPVQTLIMEDILNQTERQKAKWRNTMDWRPSAPFDTKGR